MSEAFERVLRKAASRGRNAGVCPDADLIAAYVDRSASEGERRALEAHVADCVACQQHLALLGSISIGREPAPADTTSGWLKRWGWLVPVATAVVVVGVWVRLPATDPVEPPPAPASPAAESRSARPDDRAATPSVPDMKPQGDAPRAADPARSPAPEVVHRREDRPDESRPPGVERDARALEQKAAAAAPAAKEKVRSDDRRQAFGAAVADQAPASAPPAPHDRGVPQERAADDARAGSAAALRKAEAFAPPIVATAAPERSYRAHGNRLELSRDAGASWQVERTMESGVFTTAACAGGACWFGTSDGHIERGAPAGVSRSSLPAREAVTSIAAEGPLAAVATVASGRRFRTADGGGTWSEIR